MAWQQQANIRGPQGPKGDKGDQGNPGADGKGISIAGSAPTYAALPTGLGAGDAGKGYLVQADGLLYIWTGSAFPANGSGVAFKGDTGAKGDKGDKGDTGTKGDTGAKGDTGNPGLPGADGAKGDKGDQGDPGVAGTSGSRWFTGTGAPGAVGGAVVGDLYLDTASGDVYALS